MQTLSVIRSLLDERGLRPRKRFGQNFLHDKNQLRKLIDAADLVPGSLVLEVGPGTGTLTEALLEAGAIVIACELDRDLADLVDERLGERITLIRGDCLDRGRVINPAIVEAIATRPFKLVANLPYQVASPLMSSLLIDHANCQGQYVTIQKEVADRLLSPPGTKAYGPLGIIVSALAKVERIATLAPTCFWPSPKVTSAMAAITPRDDHGVTDPASFARFVTQLFTKRRKQLGSILGRDAPLPEGVTSDQRPESLTISQLIDLSQRTAAP